MTEADQRAAVIAEALTWATPRTPYHHAGRLKGIGADCAQFPLAVYETAGIIPPTDVGAYSPQWHLHQSEEVYLRWVQGFARQIGRKPPGTAEVDGEAPAPGDFAVWKWGRTYSHGAIVVEWPTIIHAYVGIGVLVERVDQHPELLSRDARIFSAWD